MPCSPPSVRIWRWRFKLLTGDDRTRCAGCGRRRKAVVAQPLAGLRGIDARGGGAWASRRPLTSDRDLIPAGVDLRQDGAREGVAGAGAPRAPQFRLGLLDCDGGLKARHKFGDGGPEGALQQTRPFRAKASERDVDACAVRQRDQRMRGSSLTRDILRNAFEELCPFRVRERQ
jgi:hypothetical protein